MSKPVNQTTPSQTATLTAVEYSSSILTLPDEVAIHIFNYVNNARDITACGLVCKQWRDLTQDGVLWKSLFRSLFPESKELETKDLDFQKVCQEAYRDQLVSQNIANGVYASGTMDPHDEVFQLKIVDGRLISNSTSFGIKIWDLKTHQCLSRYGRKTMIDEWSPDFNVDGKCFSVCYSNGTTIKITDIKTKQHLHPIKIEPYANPFVRNPNPITSLDFCDGLLLVQYWLGSLEIWDVKTGARLSSFELVDSGQRSKKNCAYLIIDSCAYLIIDSGQFYEKFACGSDGKIVIFQKERDKEDDCKPLRLTGHKDLVTSFASAGKMLFSGSFDKTIKIWDRETGQCLQTLTAHTGKVFDIAYDDGKLFSCGNQENVIRIWDFKASNHVIFAEIAGLFMKSDASAMDRFNRMPQREKDAIYGELHRIVSFKNDYFGCAEHAFHDQHGLRTTPQQKAQAIHNHLLRKIANLFEVNSTRAMEKFTQLPKEVRDKIYGELYEIIKHNPSFKSYDCCGEHAFHDQFRLSSTPQQKAEAIRKYLSRTSK